MAFEGSYIVHLNPDSSNLDIVTGYFSSINNNVVEADVSWENVGANLQIDLVIKNHELLSQHEPVLVIEAVGKANVVIVDTQVEDIPT